MFGSRIENEFVNDARAQAAPRRTSGWRLLMAIVLGLGAFLAWAATHEIEEVVRAPGRVIPSQQLQVVQSPNGGIVAEILVREGDVVEAGAELVRIDESQARADLGELEEREAALLATLARVEAEATGAETIAFPDGLEARAPVAVAAERAVFQSRRQQLETELTVLEAQLARRRAALEENAAASDRLAGQIEPLDEEVTISAELVERDAVPRVEWLRLRRDLAELEGELRLTQAQVPGLRAAIREMESQMASARSAFVLTALERSAQVGSELSVLREALQGAADTLERTALRAPVAGTVNRITVATIGAVVQPGAQLVEIVPRDDNLLIEAQVRPGDVAFIRPGQPASVKITAYDFLIYGALDGTLERLGADAVEDARGNPVFRATVRTGESVLRAADGSPLPISPGMIAQVDVQTGRNTVLAYLLRPIRRTGAEALRER